MNITRRLFIGGAALAAADLDAMPAPRKGEGRAYLWENLTADDFLDAVRDSKGVVLVPFGCLEKHGHHLPLATDSIVACDVARRAAEKERAVVFPFSPFGMVNEVRHMGGTMALSAETMRRVFDEMCEEFARNGLDKIIIVNDHGGNNDFIGEFLRSRLEKRRPYQVYSWFVCRFTPEQTKAWNARFDGNPPSYGHACVIESSQMMALRPETVHMDRVRGDADGKSRHRYDPFGALHLQSPISWYADFPTQMCGETRGSSPELGEWLLDSFSDTLAKCIRLVKESNLMSELTEEYQLGASHPSA